MAVVETLSEGSYAQLLEEHSTSTCTVHEMIDSLVFAGSMAYALTELGFDRTITGELLQVTEAFQEALLRSFIEKYSPPYAPELVVLAAQKKHSPLRLYYMHESPRRLLERVFIEEKLSKNQLEKDCLSICEILECSSDALRQCVSLDDDLALRNYMALLITIPKRPD